MFINKGSNLSLEAIRTTIEDRSSTVEDPNSFMGIWDGMIERLHTENNGARVTTAQFCENAQKSFKKIMWRHPISGFSISFNDLKRWDDGMKSGVKDAEGKLVGKISDTTRGIYPRTVRAVWNECRRLGYLVNMEYPFSNIKQKGLTCIPSGAARKEEHLDVSKMTRLYRVFINKEYPDTWSEDCKKRVNYSLGLFLIQYPCNGFNLMDAGRLKYNQYFFDTERKAFRCKRKKTRARSESGSEVIVPIIEPLQRILDEIATKPVKGGYVSPEILKGELTS